MGESGLVNLISETISCLSMVTIPIFDPSVDHKMRVALFISGSGTNGLRIIEKSEEKKSNFEVTLIFSDVRDTRSRRNGSKMSRAKDISEKYGISYECVDIRDFYKKRGLKRTDLSIRPEYDRLVLERIRGHEIDLIVNAGYMSIMTPVLLDEYEGKMINVHPADLSIMDGDRRKYVGIHVVEDAILSGDQKIYSTTHIVREEVDGGEILVISAPVRIQLEVQLEKLADNKKLRKTVVSEYQIRLKEAGDWVVLPMTVQMISEGRFALGVKGAYLDGIPVPSGYRLE
jgi:folate-dependent phosphoribosylglycinamide formyltransferase PurN